MQSTFNEAEIREAEHILIGALKAPDVTAWIFHYTEDAILWGWARQRCKAAKPYSRWPKRCSRYRR